MPDDWELREAENDFNEVKMRGSKQRKEEANITRIIMVPLSSPSLLPLSSASLLREPFVP